MRQDYKGLFKLSVDNNLPDLIEALIKKDHDSIIPISRKLFYLDNETRIKPRYDALLKESNNSNEIQIKLLLHVNSHLRNNNDYINCLKNQYNLLESQESNIENFLEVCSVIKKELFNNYILEIQNRIEIINGEKRDKLDYEKICLEITPNYINLLIGKNEFETAVIKLCVKLEAKLKYVYKYEGEFKVMLDTYIQKNTKLANLLDDEDNNYFPNKQHDPRRIEVTRLLNKLRMVRNGIVHSTPQQEMLSKDELCVITRIIEKI